MTDNNECFNSEDMSEDELRETLESVHDAYHDALEVARRYASNAGALIEALAVLSGELKKGDVLGTRHRTMEGVRVKASTIVTMATLAMPGALLATEETAYDNAFDQLASQLDGDPDFNPSAEGD